MIYVLAFVLCWLVASVAAIYIVRRNRARRTQRILARLDEYHWERIKGGYARIGLEGESYEVAVEPPTAYPNAVKYGKGVGVTQEESPRE